MDIEWFKMKRGVEKAIEEINKGEVIDEFFSRLKLLLEEKKFSKRQFTLAVHVSPSFLTRASDMSLSNIVRILLLFPDISPDWLLFGREPMYRNQVTETVGDDITTKEMNEQLPIISGLMDMLKLKDMQISDLLEDKRRLRDELLRLKHTE